MPYMDGPTKVFGFLTIAFLIPLAIGWWVSWRHGSSDRTNAMVGIGAFGGVACGLIFLLGVLIASPSSRPVPPDSAFTEAKITTYIESHWEADVVDIDGDGIIYYNTAGKSCNSYWRGTSSGSTIASFQLYDIDCETLPPPKKGG